jgi:predicted membrane protein
MKDKLPIITPVVIIAIALFRFFDSSVFAMLQTEGESDTKEFVIKSICWGIFFGGLVAALAVQLGKFVKNPKSTSESYKS